MKKLFLLLPIIFILVGYPVNAQSSKGQEKSNSSNSQRSEKVKKLKDFEKPAKTDSKRLNKQSNTDPANDNLQSGPRVVSPNKGNANFDNVNDKALDRANTNSKLYKEKVTKVSENLQIIGEELEDDSQSSPELEQAAEEIEEVADESEEDAEQVSEIIDDIESQNRFKRLLFGTDYKNLGQLRSNLVKNENQIRKLTRNVERVQDEETQLQLQEQLATLTQERERIKTVITENESGFSLLGWARRLFSGYNNEPIETPEEDELIDDVSDVVDDEVLEDNQEETQEPEPTVAPTSAITPTQPETTTN